MDSTSASSFVASFQFNEIDYFVMLMMTFFLGWRIGETVRVHFKKLPRSKASKPSHKTKISEDNVTVARQVTHPAGSAEINQKEKRCLSPKQTSVAKAADPKPAGPEQLASEIAAVHGLEPPPGLPLSRSTDSQAMQRAPWRKPAASVAPDASPEDAMPRQLGRVVCWKETGYGFVVNEAGERLFVRQAEVEGGEQLRAGQLVWFRRGKSPAGQAAKALNVTIVSQEEAKVMRKFASKRSGSSPKAANKALALPSAASGGGADCRSGHASE
jgi:cold shock CspA family protein